MKSRPKSGQKLTRIDKKYWTKGGKNKSKLGRKQSKAGQKLDKS